MQAFLVRLMNSSWGVRMGRPISVRRIMAYEWRVMYLGLPLKREVLFYDEIRRSTPHLLEMTRLSDPYQKW